MQKTAAQKCCSHVPEKKYSRILEIGAGGGLLTELCLQRLSPADIYVALDISLGMLKLAAADRTCLIQADGEIPPFKPGTFSLLISSSAMQWYHRGPESALRNIRLLKENGFFSLAFFVRGTFQQMEHVSSLTGFGSLYPLPSAEHYIESFRTAGLKPGWSLQEYTEYYSSVSAFLKSHKKTGATYTGSQAKFGKKTYRNFCRVYEDLYAEAGLIPAGYKVLYLWGYN
ncbi:MAG: class I SAM-dependent methyltransferase [Desulfonatronovibrio sp.]